MSGSLEKPWPGNPNALKTPSWLYLAEKGKFAGDVIGTMCYGIVIVLFFQCMAALLNPADRTRGGIRWTLVIPTAAMFSFATIGIGLGLSLQSISYVDNREFPGDDVLPLGPLGYKLSVYSMPIIVVPYLIFLLNQLLADGLLLYRCYVIYSMNYWIIAFPSLMYLATMVMGIMYILRGSKSGGTPTSVVIDFGYPYFSISFALNIILTLMIVVRLVLHNRNIRAVMKATAGTSGLYGTIVTILTESCALYVVSFVLFVGPQWSSNVASYIFWPILTQTQVIASFLIIQRVANRRAVTGNAIIPGNVSSIRFGSQGRSSDCNEILPGGDPTRSMETNRRVHGELGVGASETTIDSHQEKLKS